MRKALKTLLLTMVLFPANAAFAGDLEGIFNDLTSNQRKYVQIRLRLPGFYQNAVDGQFGSHTVEAIRSATATPGYSQYKAQAVRRGVQDEETIAIYYVMSDIYLRSVVHQ